MPGHHVPPATAIATDAPQRAACSTDPDPAPEETQADDTELSESPPTEIPTPSGDGIGSPDIQLPDDMNNVFEDTETGDPVKDATIADVRGWIQSMDMGFAAGDPGHEAMEFYATGEGLVSSRQFVRGSSDEGLTWAGTVVYYDFEVRNEGDLANRPIVGYCQDITDLDDKDLESGEIKPSSVDDPKFFLYTQVVVRENDLGVWQVERVLPGSDELDRECER